MKNFLTLTIFIFLSCSGANNQNKETKIIEKYFNSHKFTNSKENFNKINVDLLGIKSEKLQDGYNDFLA
ncbi:hypothetical protein KB553_22325 [Chryseobacterium rhizoplanae]|uniref:Uncharacterized protein n=1 Tax=Chryseobacterium bernardetii TaxID=1241978 RepID=A0A3G6T868_9FLAO|nr:MULTISPECIES: hypothetical protein [Chryseobacterium]AZB25485.1 hypothetical protein EG339_13290 [Chryseobacterium bernardetii]UCA59707.1 hypothetical protein KB553_22325 [Chryseobacterium rhizoplanae]